MYRTSTWLLYCIHRWLCWTNKSAVAWCATHATRQDVLLVRSNGIDEEGVFAILLGYTAATGHLFANSN